MQKIKDLMVAQKIIKDDFQLDGATSLEQLGLDSLGIADFIFTLEDEFNIRIDDNQMGITVVDDVVRLVESLSASNASVVLS